MNDTPRKPYVTDGPVPPLRALKLCSPEDRAWAAKLQSGNTSKKARKLIGEKLNIHLGTDGTYTEFLNWQRLQARWDALDARMQHTEDALKEKFPTLSREDLRDRVIKLSYATAAKDDDVELALKVMDRDLGDSRERRDWQKFQFDAAKKCLKVLPTLKAIATNKELSDKQRIDAVRQAVFGDLPS